MLTSINDEASVFLLSDSLFHLINKISSEPLIRDRKDFDQISRIHSSITMKLTTGELW